MKKVMYQGFGGLFVLYLTLSVPALWAVPGGEEPPENGGPGNSPISFGEDRGASSRSIECGGHVVYQNNTDVLTESVLVHLQDNCKDFDSEIECRDRATDPESVTASRHVGDGKIGSLLCDLPPGGAAFVVCNGFEGGCDVIVVPIPFVPFGNDRVE